MPQIGKVFGVWIGITTLAFVVGFGVFSIQAEPIQAEPIQAEPIQAEPIQVELKYSPCQVSIGANSKDAECAILKRLENPSDPNSKVLDIFLTRFPALAPQAASDAFTVIQGGPGMSSIDMFIQMEPMFKEIRRKRDVLVIDQRGTGRSNMLRCSDFDTELDLDFDLEVISKLTNQCIDEVTIEQGSDLAFYTTSVAVDDLEAARIASGYEALSLYGVSYGTRVAQHYLRKYPATSRAAILDGVADIGTNLAGSEIAVRSQKAWEAVVTRCAQQPSCTDAFGDLQLSFDQLRQKLKDHPETVKLAHPESGLPTEQLVGESQLLGAIRLMPYATESLALLPFIVHSANQGNLTPLAAHALQLNEQFSKHYSYPMNNSVVCSEDAQFVTQEDLAGQENTYFGTEFSETMLAMCELWPKGPVDDNFRQPFDSTTPVLILSGETDPITPPENGAATHKMLTNSKHIVVPAHGHGVIGRGCVAPLANQFINTASFENMNVSCVERERAMPFFLSPAGPNP